MKKILEVKTGADKYKIFIGDNILSSSGLLIKKKLIRQRVFIITNKLIYKLYGKKLENTLKKNKINFSKIIINDGEQYKNIKTINLITSKLLNYKIDRNDTLIAFGGGVIGDLVGFAASIPLPHSRLPENACSESSEGVHAPMGQRWNSPHSASPTPP